MGSREDAKTLVEWCLNEINGENWAHDEAKGDYDLQSGLSNGLKKVLKDMVAEQWTDAYAELANVNAISAPLGAEHAVRQAILRVMELLQQAKR
ncbi:hypothetical protein J4219_01630 [Candidatus Woesearchaeota archaeon]|nr:hypothetical protein [Candidatus Woesearchaeota archaeon]